MFWVNWSGFATPEQTKLRNIFISTVCALRDYLALLFREMLTDELIWDTKSFSWNRLRDCLRHSSVCWFAANRIYIEKKENIQEIVQISLTLTHVQYDRNKGLMATKTKYLMWSGTVKSNTKIWRKEEKDDKEWKDIHIG